MAGMKELMEKLKEDQRFRNTLAQITDPEVLMEKVKDAGYDVDLETIRRLLKIELPDAIADKIPGDLKVSDVLENDAVKSGLKALGKFF